jgi:hypothetical protein
MARSNKVGRFIPKNPQKYVGKLDQIIYRSSWELKLMRHLDTNQLVKKWGSEELAINYFDPTTNQNRRYFPDMFAIIIKDGKEVKVMIEVKPFHETVEPKPRYSKNGKPVPNYLIEEATYQTNTAKWEAARQFCNQHGVQFILMTEYELGIAKRF